MKLLTLGSLKIYTVFIWLIYHKKPVAGLKRFLILPIKLKQAEKQKLISPEQAEIWNREITKSTEAILVNKTLTKSKSEEIYVISNQKMLADVTNKYLTEGEK